VGNEDFASREGLGAGFKILLIFLWFVSFVSSKRNEHPKPVNFHMMQAMKFNAQFLPLEIEQY